MRLLTPAGSAPDPHRSVRPSVRQDVVVSRRAVLLFVALGAQSLHLVRRHCRRHRGPLLHARFRHANHGIRHPIGLLLVRVGGLADRKLRLDRRGTSLCTAL